MDGVDEVLVSEDLLLFKFEDLMVVDPFHENIFLELHYFFMDRVKYMTSSEKIEDILPFFDRWGELDVFELFLLFQLIYILISLLSNQDIIDFDWLLSQNIDTVDDRIDFVEIFRDVSPWAEEFETFLPFLNDGQVSV